MHQIELEMQNEELVRTQRELEQSRQNYFELYDLAPVGYLTLSEHSLILELNLAAAALVGTERGRLLMQPFSQLVHPEDQAIYYQKRKALFEGENDQKFELRLLNRAGGVVWVHAQAVLAQDRSGQPIARLSLGDITERMRNESALFQAQKLESLGVLAGGMAHDFNNLLAAMLGNIELLDLDTEAGARVRRQALLQECVLRAAALCRQLLAYAGRAPFVREPTRMGDLIESHLGFMRLSLAKGVELELDLAPDLPEVEGDPAQIQQALMNLVCNASEAIGPGGGTIRIRTRARALKAGQLPDTVADTRVEPGPYVVVEVQDSGSGMSPDILERIFDPFFTTKFIGRGLGLAALQGIMRVNGGAVQVRSQPGHGSYFALWFPQARRAEAAEPEAPPMAEIQGTGTILIVDDDPQVRAVLNQHLLRMGFKVLEAPDGQAALATYRRHPGPIRLVFLDLTMPHMSGTETAKRILAEFPAARIVLMSGYSQGSRTDSPGSERIRGFLGKPFLHSQLEAALRRGLEA